MKNYFAILEIPENSSPDEIKQAYRRMAKAYHPDVNRSPQAHDKFIEISEAYEVLMHRASAKTDEPEEEVFNYDEFVREVREAAKRQARMRYEKFARENEALRESGLYDIGLLLKYIGRVVVPLLGLFLIGLPFGVAISEKSIAPVGYLFFSWLFGAILLWDTYGRRKNYFKLGAFYYSPKKIKQLFLQTNDLATETCFYCNGLKANSIPVEIALVKVKDIQLQNDGPLQHRAGFKRKEFSIKMPRSQKALFVHTTVSGIKVFCILVSMVFAPFSSLAWRFIAGCFVGWTISSIVLLVTRTRSKSSYLLSWGMLIKIAFWTGVLVSISTFHFPDIRTSGYIQLVVITMLTADSFLEQLLKLISRRVFIPFSKRYELLRKHFEDNCQLYLETSAWTTIYPFFRWIF